MKRQRILLDYVHDMYDNDRKAMRFVEGLNFDQFREDERAQYAVVRALEIIGEASKILEKCNHAGSDNVQGQNVLCP